MAFPGRGGSPEDDPQFEATASKIHDDFVTKNLDAKTAFEEAFADDAEMRDGINRIVEELEGKVPPKKTSNVAKPETSKESAVTRIKAARKQKEAVELEAKAKADAAAWLQSRVNARALKEASPKASMPSTAAPKSSPANVRPSEASSRSVAASKPSKADGGICTDFVMPSLEAVAEPLGVWTRLRLPEKPPDVDDGQFMPSCGTCPKCEIETKNLIPDPEFYRLLDISVDATFEEIKKAFRRQALQWHPDKNRDQPEKATDMFKRINEAFDTLFDPQRRKAYDSGQVKMRSKAKKLQGHGWSNAADEDDSALTPLGFKLKKQAWNSYIYFGGRWDDVDPLTDYENDPRAPQEKIKVFWRFIGEKAHDAREKGYFSAGERASDRCDVGHDWKKSFVEGVWNGTPSRWPGSQELQAMNETSRQEWLERRMIYNRRKQKVLLHLDLHIQYLALPDRIKKEKEVLRKIWGDRIKD